MSNISKVIKIFIPIHTINNGRKYDGSTEWQKK